MQVAHDFLLLECQSVLYRRTKRPVNRSWNVCWWRVLPVYSHVKEIEARALRSEGNRPCLMVAGKLVFWSGRQGKNTNALPAPYMTLKLFHSAP
jgi:hypothetical protein